MLRKVIKKVGVVLLAAGLSIGMFSPSVSAAVKINKAAQMKAAKNVEPEEWNKEELTAYQFDTGDDFLKYMVTGGLHLYNKNYKVKDAIIVHTIEELLEEIKKYPSEEVYCIGGDSVYKQLLPYCDIAHVTKIDFGYEADSYFPNLDEMPEWKITAESDEQTYFDLEYSFVKYERVK